MFAACLAGLALIGAERGFTPLFNGTDLEGWMGDTTGYLAQAGEIRVAPQGASGKGPGFLYTKGTWGDFELRFEFKLTPGANNGLAIRAPGTGNPAFDAMEVQILDNTHPMYATLKPWQYHGSIYGVAAARRGFLKPVGEWNDETVICDGDRVTVILNGHVLLDADLAEARSNGTVDGQAHPGLNRPSGHLGFCGHGSEVAFRNIRIRPLAPASAPPPSTDSERGS
ncbi:MAG: DUF1080 domain-containing protein [Phycisphaerales bacterium]|nr:DUF1080 domain-containing protein [Phycisphaerales bacterium]